MHIQKSNKISKKFFSQNRGLVKAIVLVIAGLLLMAYLGFNLRSIVESKTFTDNLEFIKNLAITIWENYLRDVSIYVYEKIILPFIWEPLVSLISSKS